MCGAGALEDLARLAVEEERGLARLLSDDLHIVPADASAPARLEGLERGLLGGEARSVVLCGGRAARVAVGALRVGEDARAETRRARDDLAHAPDFDNVYADGDDHT